MRQPARVNAPFTVSDRPILNLTAVEAARMVAIARLLHRLTLAAALFLAPSFAHVASAAPVAAPTPATGTVTLMKPATYRNLRELNFAYLAVTTEGTALIDPDRDAMSTTGGVIHVGGTPYAARFEGISPNRNVVLIRIPRNPATLTRVGGTETMTVSDWILSGSSRRTVVAQEPFDFSVGGTLFDNANQAEGTYVGTLNVDVQYQ